MTDKKEKDPLLVEKHRRQGRKARRKGSTNERAVAKILELWWGKGVFKRTPLSGGWGNREEFKTCGDIQCSDSLWPFHVEIKARESWMLEQLICGYKTNLAKWWLQTITECPEGKKPLMIFTKNNYPFFCMLKIADVPKIAILWGTGIFFKEWVILPLNDFCTLTDRNYWLGIDTKKYNEEKIAHEPTATNAAA